MIFFDIDGTLFDQVQAEKLAAIYFFKENKNELQLNHNDFMSIREIYNNNYVIYLLKQLSAQERNRMLMRDLFGQHISNEVADQKLRDFFTIYKQHWTPFHDVIPCLQQLKSNGLHLGVISNGDYERQIDKLEKLGVRGYFDVIVVSNQVKLAKPDKKFFWEACNNAKVKPEHAYYVGDDLVYDAIASKNAGMNGVWINRKNRTKYNDLSVIHSLSELDNVIK